MPLGQGLRKSSFVSKIVSHGSMHEKDLSHQVSQHLSDKPIWIRLGSRHSTRQQAFDSAASIHEDIGIFMDRSSPGTDS